MNKMKNIEKLAMAGNTNLRLEKDLNEIYAQNKELDFNEVGKDLSFMFDFIYTPGSGLRFHNDEMLKHPEKVGTLDDYLGKGTAYLFEGFRLALYGAFVNKYFKKENKE